MFLTNQMLTLFRAADLHEERVRILRVLGSVKQPELIKRVLEFSLSDEVRSQVRDLLKTRRENRFVATKCAGAVMNEVNLAFGLGQ